MSIKETIKRIQSLDNGDEIHINPTIDVRWGEEYLENEGYLDAEDLKTIVSNFLEHVEVDDDDIGM